MFQVPAGYEVNSQAQCGSLLDIERISTKVSFQKLCPLKNPPGRKVYEDGPLAIWAVDGATDQVDINHFFPKYSLKNDRAALLSELVVIREAVYLHQDYLF